jgi:hypothetical protein
MPNAHSVLTQRIAKFVGACSFGTHWNESAVNGAEHHGQTFSGAGARVVRLSR